MSGTLVLRIVIGLFLCSLVACGMFTGAGAHEPPARTGDCPVDVDKHECPMPQFKPWRTSMRAPPGQQVYVLLVQYEDGHFSPGYSDRLSRWLSRETGPDGRVVTFPDSYVPVLVPKRRAKALQKQLGAELLPLSPSLELGKDIP